MRHLVGSAAGLVIVLLLSFSGCSDEREAQPCPTCLTAVSASSGAGGNVGGGTPAPDIEWVDSFGNAQEQRALSVASDSMGNFYVAGHYSGAVDFGGGKTLPTIVGTDSFLLKMDRAGTVIWAHPFGQDSMTMTVQFDIDVAVDSQDNVVVVGPVVNTTTVGVTNEQTFTQMGENELFVAKLDPAGALVWATMFGTMSTSPTVRDVAIDSSDHIILVGDMLGGGNYFGNQLPDTGLFLAKLDGDGTPAFVNYYPHSSQFFLADSVAVDSAGDIVLSGVFQHTLTVDGADHISSGFDVFDIFMMKVDVTGTDVWFKSFGTSSAQQAEALEVDAAGNITLVGNFLLPVDLGTGELSPPDETFDFFIARFNPAGEAQWAQHFPAAADQVGLGLTLTPAGEAVAVGAFNQTLSIVSTPLSATTNEDLFVTKLAGDGTPQWALSVGGEGAQFAYDATVLPDGSTVFVGYTAGAADFGDGMGETFSMVIGKIAPE